MFRTETIALTPDLRAELERRIADAPTRAGIAVRFVGKTVVTIVSIAAVLYVCAAAMEYVGSLVFAPRRSCVLTSSRGPLAAMVPLAVALTIASALALWISQLEWRSHQSAAAAARRALTSGSVRRITLNIDERHRLVECDETVLLLQPDEVGGTIIVWLDALEGFVTERETCAVGREWAIDVATGIETPLAFAANGPSITLDFDGMMWLDADDLPVDLVETPQVVSRVATSLDRLLAKAQPLAEPRTSANPTAPVQGSRPVPAA